LRLPLSAGTRLAGAAPPPRPAAARPSDQQLLGTYDGLLDEFMPPSLLINEHHELPVGVVLDQKRPDGPLGAVRGRQRAKIVGSGPSQG
jgi:hypothetical protein